MPEYRRWHVPGGTIFFTVVTHQRAGILTEPQTRRLLGRTIRDCRNAYPFEVIASVLLPDHLHMIWTLPPNDDNFSLRWAWIKGNFTRQYIQSGGSERSNSHSRNKHRMRGVWQKRFHDHVIRDEDDLIHHVEYVHYNPVKHGHVECPIDWPWSSIHRYIRDGIYKSDWCCPKRGWNRTTPDFSKIEKHIGE